MQTEVMTPNVKFFVLQLNKNLFINNFINFFFHFSFFYCWFLLTRDDFKFQTIWHRLIAPCFPLPMKTKIPRNNTEVHQKEILVVESRMWVCWGPQDLRKQSSELPGSSISQTGCWRNLRPRFSNQSRQKTPPKKNLLFLAKGSGRRRNPVQWERNLLTTLTLLKPWVLMTLINLSFKT